MVGCLEAGLKVPEFRRTINLHSQVEWWSGMFFHDRIV